MLLKTIQWNIGGGKIRKPDDSAEGPYSENGLEQIESVLKKYQPDLVFLQETHSDTRNTQTEIIAKSIGLPNLRNDTYDRSHLEDDQELGQAIISRWPISEHNFELFTNPHFQITGQNGEIWTSNNKGVSKCLINLGVGQEIQVATLHLIPFRRFGINPLEDQFETLRENISSLARPSKTTFLLQGDFNFNETSLEQFLPGLLNQNISEVLLDKPTTPKGRKYDHIIFRDIKHIKSEVITDVLTDHFPVYSEFEI